MVNAAATLPSPPELQDLAIQCLRALGITGGPIVACVTIAFILKAWLDWFRDIHQGAMRAGQVIENVGGRLLAVTWLERTIMCALTVLVMIAQVGVTLMAYIVGNGLSMLFSGDPGVKRWESLKSAWETGGIRSTVSLGDSFLKVDTYATIVLAVAMLSILASYRFSLRKRAATDTDTDALFFWGILLAMPISLVLLGAVAFIAFQLFLVACVAVMGLFIGDWSAIPDMLKAMLPLVAVAAASGLYCLLCQAATRGAALVTATWR